MFKKKKKKKKKKTFLAFAVALLYFYTKQVPNIQTFSNIQYNTILAMRDNMPAFTVIVKRR